jgi:hypothetical protein
MLLKLLNKLQFKFEGKSRCQILKESHNDELMEYYRRGVESSNIVILLSLIQVIVFQLRPRVKENGRISLQVVIFHQG